MDMSNLDIRVFKDNESYCVEGVVHGVERKSQRRFHDFSELQSTIDLVKNDLGFEYVK